MIYSKDNSLVHFIHNPRTAGRWIGNFIFESGYKPLINSTAFFGGRQISHLTYDMAKEFYLPEQWTENSFCIVRNPVERFISGFQLFISFSMIKNLILLEDYEYFNFIMENKRIETYADGSFNENFTMNITGLKNAHCGFWQKQKEYIGSNTKIWKYEDGINKNFVEWLKEEVKVDVNLDIIDKVSHNQYYFDNKPVVLSDKIKENIHNYYLEDLSLYYT